MYSKPRVNKNTPVVNKPGRVTLALQLVSGERLTAEFSPESNFASRLHLFDDLINL